MTRRDILASLGDLGALSAEIREINEANGWREGQPFDWDDRHKVPSYIALIHSEISEAWIGVTQVGKDNYAEELADVVIRILDALEGLGVDAEHWVVGAMGRPWFSDDDEDTLLAAHYLVSEALESFRKGDKNRFADMLGNTIVVVFDLCKIRDIDLNDAIRAKLARNRERGYRHGNKRV